MLETEVISKMNKITHVHKSSEQADCDGIYENSRVIFPRHNEDGRELWSSLIGLEIDLAFDYEARNIERTVDYYGFPHLIIFGPTEEGWKNIEMVGCDNPYCRPDSRYRDRSAEAMNY